MTAATPTMFVPCPVQIHSLDQPPEFSQNASMNPETPTANPLQTEPPATWRPPIPWLACVVLLGCIAVAVLYWFQTRLPDQITIAGGPPDGRYHQLAEALAEELAHRLEIEVNVDQTLGSLENLHWLESNKVQLGLYQSETKVILEQNENSTTTARFIANLYPEYLIPVVSTADAPDLTQLHDSVVSCNEEQSGDHAMLMLLMNHLGYDRPTKYIPYHDLPQAMRDGDVDLAIISCGLEAPVLEHVLNDNHTKLADIPFLASFVSKNMALTKRTIPAGYFAMQPTPVPAHDFETVTTQAQLLASEKSPVRIVESVTEILMDPRFQRKMKLTDLATGGEEYARSRPEFPVHIGASHIYNPELKPLINPDFVEGTEGLRSFLVSIVVAIWLARRWWHRRTLLSQEHRLDRYIRDVLQIERDQIGVDGDQRDDDDALQQLLDRVTHLRQAALSEFTAHELNEDQAVDCFVEMCHALSDKISGKLTRHTLRQLAQTLPSPVTDIKPS
jgi:TRAP transporter TAXI family solute receptor